MQEPPPVGSRKSSSKPPRLKSSSLQLGKFLPKMRRILPSSLNIRQKSKNFYHSSKIELIELLSPFGMAVSAMVPKKPQSVTNYNWQVGCSSKPL